MRTQICDGYPFKISFIIKALSAYFLLLCGPSCDDQQERGPTRKFLLEMLGNHLKSYASSLSGLVVPFRPLSLPLYIIMSWVNRTAVATRDPSVFIADDNSIRRKKIFLLCRG